MVQQKNLATRHTLLSVTHRSIVVDRSLGCNRNIRLAICDSGRAAAR